MSSAGARRRALRAAAPVALALALAAGGCGGNGDFANEPRPATPITVSAVIAPRGVSVSPARFGAGSVELLVSNQTAAAQRLRLRSRRLAPGGRTLTQTTGPISPGDTASLKADVDRGTYVVSVRSAAIAPATIVVGAARDDAQDGSQAP
jgi:hypothetical protein